jgi:hypothetical protein
MKNIAEQVLGDMYNSTHGPPKKRRIRDVPHVTQFQSTPGFPPIVPIRDNVSKDGFARIAPDLREKRTRDYMIMRASPINVPPQNYDPITSRSQTRNPKPGFVSSINISSNSIPYDTEFRPITKSPVSMEEGLSSGRSTPSSVGEYLDTINIDTSDETAYGQYDKNFYGGRKRKTRRVRRLKRTRRKSKRSKKKQKHVSKKNKNKSKSIRYHKKSKNRH